MPDTEAQAPETPAVETPEAPAKKGKQSEAEKIAAAAAKLTEIEKKPADPTKEAPGEPEKPVAEAAPAEPEKPAVRPEDVPLSQREGKSADWREYRRRATKLEKSEQAFVARETRVADIEKKMQAWEDEKKLLRENPKAFWAKQAQEAGSDFTKEYEKLANAYIEDGKPETQLSAAMQRIEELEKKLAEDTKKAEAARRAEQERQVFGAFLRVAVSDEHKHTALTYRRHGEETVMTDAAVVARSLYERHGRPPSDVEIARELDLQYQAYYKEIVDSHSGLSQPSQGVAERVNGADQSAKPVAPKAPKTLTNGGAAERATPARKLTERERIEAATKLLPG